MTDFASMAGLAITQAIVVLGAAWRLSSKLSALTERVGELDRRLDKMDKKIDHLDSKREAIALIPAILERLSNLEHWTFRGKRDE